MFPSQHLGIRALGRSLKISATQVARLTRPLIQQKLLTAETIGRNKVISVNSQNDDFYVYKSWINLFMLLDSGILTELKQQHPKTAVLFGSFRRGQDDENSDIDIALSPPNTLDTTLLAKKLHRQISIHDVSKLASSTIANVRDGVLLWGVMP